MLKLLVLTLILTSMETRIIKALKENEKGLTIADLVVELNFSRFKIRTALSRLEGAREVSFKKAGMAKIYSLKVQPGGKE